MEKASPRSGARFGQRGDSVSRENLVTPMELWTAAAPAAAVSLLISLLLLELLEPSGVWPYSLVLFVWGCRWE